MVPAAAAGQALAAVQLATAEAREQTERMATQVFRDRLALRTWKDGDKGRIGTGFVGTLPKSVWEKLVPGGS